MKISNLLTQNLIVDTVATRDQEDEMLSTILITSIRAMESTAESPQELRVKAEAFKALGHIIQ